jgi:hypothetical protein
VWWGYVEFQGFLERNEKSFIVPAEIPIQPFIVPDFTGY